MKSLFRHEIMGFRANSEKSNSQSLQTLRAYEAIFNNFRFYTEMSCYLVPAEDPEEWICLQSDLKHFHIKEFEALFGKNEERHRYNLEHFNQLARGKKPVCSVFSGFHNYFVPVLKSGKCIAFLTSGVFLKDVPTREELERQWEAWSGRKPLPGDADFKRFVASALNAALLDGPQASAHLELLEMTASLVSGEGDPWEIASQATRLNHRVFAKWKLDARWPLRALGLETEGTNRVWPSRRPEALDRVTAGIKRVPRAAIAVLLADSSESPSDEVEAMIRQKRLERAGFFLARQLGETVAFPLWDEGLVFLTSPRPGASNLQAKLQLRETARMITQQLGAIFNLRAHTGIGSIVPEGDGLNPSCNEALRALQWAVHRNRKVLSNDEVERLEIKPARRNRPWPDAPRLVETCLKGLKAEENSALDNYLTEVFHHAAGRPDLVRTQLLDAICLYASSLEKRLLLPVGRFSGFIGDWTHRFGKMRSTREMDTAFREAMKSFKELSMRPSAAKAKSTVLELKSYLSEHFRSPFTARQAAKQMGISRATLHRYARQWLGMGIQPYLQKLRLEEAKRLLRGTRLGAGRVARECGFASSGYFIRVFKKSTGKTPHQFRNTQGS